MADKTVNVKIQYNVDSSQVQKSEQLLKQAQTTANQFQASAQKSGKAVSTEFATANRSIEGMKISLARLKTQLELASDPKAVKRLTAEYQKLKAQLDSATKSAFQLPKALNETGKATVSLASQFGQLYSAIQLVFAAGVIKQTVMFALEMNRLSGRVEGVTRAFNTLPDATLLLEDLRRRTHGTVGDLELMQKALMSQSYKIPLQNLGSLLEFAAVRAQQTGQEVNHLVDFIVTGIGLRSVRRLDDLGFTAARLKEALGGVTVQAASMGAVTEAVTKLMNEDIQRFGGYVETAETDVQNLEVTILHLKETLAKELENRGLVKWFNDVLKLGAEPFMQAAISSFSFKNFIPAYGQIKFLKDFGDALGKIARDQAIENQALEKYKEFSEEANKNRSESLKLAQLQIVQNVELANRNKDEIKSFEERNEQLKKNESANRVQIEQNKEAVKFYQFQNDLFDAFNKLLQKYIVDLQKVNGVTEEQLGIIEELRKKIEGLQDAIETSRSVEEIESLNKELFVTEAQLQELLNLGRTTFTGLSKEFIDARLRLIEFNQAFRDASLANPTDTQFQTGTAKDLTVPTFEDLSKDTVSIIKGIAKKQGEEFNKALGDSVDISSEIERAWFNAKDTLVQGGIDIFADQLFSIETAELASLENRLNNLRNFYDEQMILAGDNERAKSELRLNEERETARLQKKMAEKERQVRRFSIIIDTAAAIAKTAAQLGFPAAIPFIALAAAQGASQLAIVNRTPARFAKGGLNIQGKGTGTSDSIDAKLSKGESVMTAQEWKTSKNVLKEVRAKTLDDKVLSDLKLTRDGVKYVGMDDKRIIGKLDELKNSFPDIEERSGLIYSTRRKSDTYKQWIRKSSMSN